MTVMDPRDLDLEVAAPEEAAQIHALRAHLVDWLTTRGIDQWGHGDVSADDVRAQTDRGEWYVLRHPDTGVGAAMRLTAEDPDVWEPDDARAVYVHGLMVHREFGAVGLGARMLGWIEALAGDLGARLLRADCNEDNDRLRAYYRDLGFAEVGRRDFDDHRHAVVLLEKSLVRRAILETDRADRRARLRAEAETLPDDPDDLAASRALAAEMDADRAW